MRTHWVKYLSLLGFLGFLGLYTGQVAHYGWFGHFGWARFAKIKNDERLEENVNRACKNSFILSLIISSLTFALVATTGNTDLYRYAFVVIFVVHILIFQFSFHYYDNRDGD